MPSNAQRIQGAGPCGAGDPVDVCQAPGETFAVVGGYERVTGIIANAGESVEIDMRGMGSVGVSLQYVGGATGSLAFEITGDDTHWLGVELQNYATPSLITIQSTNGDGAIQAWGGGFDGISKFRVFANGAITGTIAVILENAIAGRKMPITASPASPGFVSAGRYDSLAFVVKRVSQAFWILPESVLNEIDNSSMIGSNKFLCYSVEALYDPSTGFMVAQRNISTHKPLNAVAINPAAAIWTPAAGKMFRLMGYHLQCSVTGNVLLKDGAGGTLIAVVPCIAGGEGVPVKLGNGILSTTANNILEALGPAASTVSGIVYGVEE